MNITIWSLLLSHRYGDEVHVFASHAAAIAWLADYCERRWDDVPGDVDMPADSQERIEAYFEHMADELANVEGHEFGVSLPTDALLQEALGYEAEAFENDTEINLPQPIGRHHVV